MEEGQNNNFNNHIIKKRWKQKKEKHYRNPKHRKRYSLKEAGIASKHTRMQNRGDTHLYSFAIAQREKDQNKSSRYFFPENENGLTVL